MFVPFLYYIWYSGRVIKYETELNVIAHKLLTMHGGFCMSSDVDRLYGKRKKGVRGLISVEFAKLFFYERHSKEDPYWLLECLKILR